jgi:hypothetical protein
MEKTGASFQRERAKYQSSDKLTRRHEILSVMVRFAAAIARRRIIAKGQMTTKGLGRALTIRVVMSPGNP